MIIIPHKTKNIGFYSNQMVARVALGTSLYGLVRPAVAFESAMADVKKVVNFDTPQQIKEMENAIKKLSKRIPIAIDGLTQMVATGGQLGVSRDQLAVFAETASKMSIAFDIGADEASQSMAKLSNVLQVPISEMTTDWKDITLDYQLGKDRQGLEHLLVVVE